MACGRTAVPRTRSGKTLRRVLRDVLASERARADGMEAMTSVRVPDTVEDSEAVELAREAARRYFASRGGTKSKL